MTTDLEHCQQTKAAYYNDDRLLFVQACPIYNEVLITQSWVKNNLLRKTYRRKKQIIIVLNTFFVILAHVQYECLLFKHVCGTIKSTKYKQKK